MRLAGWLVAGVASTRKDIAAFTAKSLDDPRTLNKRLVIAPPCNFATQPELVKIWEAVSGQKIQQTPISAQELEQQINGKAYARSGLSWRMSLQPYVFRPTQVAEIFCHQQALVNRH